jgi:hypothetical protein
LESSFPERSHIIEVPVSIYSRSTVRKVTTEKKTTMNAEEESMRIEECIVQDTNHTMLFLQNTCSVKNHLDVLPSTVIAAAVSISK